MKYVSTAVWHLSYLARRRRPTRRAIPILADAGRVSINKGWCYRYLSFEQGSTATVKHLSLGGHC